MIDSRPLGKKGLYQGGLPVNILELSALLQEGLTWAPVFWKIEKFVLQGCNFIKTPAHHWFFPQNILFETASFQYIFQKQSVVSSLYSKVADWTLKELHHRIFSEKVFILQSVIFRNIFIYEEWNYMKD